MFILLASVVSLLPSATDSLVCPVYNVFNNATRTIQTCDTGHSLCTYMKTRSTSRRCLGIYAFETALSIRIRQLAMIDDFEDVYSNATKCILDADRTGQSLLCRCNSDNCTLAWKIADRVDHRIFANSNLIKQPEVSNWLLPLTITCAMVISIAIIVLILMIRYHRCSGRREKIDRSFLADLSSASTSVSNAEIDEFLSSSPTYESIISRGKTSTIYRAWMTGKGYDEHEKRSVAVKLYHGQEHRALFENEVQILKIVQHAAIVR